MRRLNLLPCLLALTFFGCWNFEALTGKSVVGGGDGGTLPDLYYCPTEKNALREDCTDGIDNNNDCLVDCDDPQCGDYIACVDKKNQLIGYGSSNDKSFTCTTGTTQTDIKQGLQLAADCSNGCACQATTNWKCGSTLHWFNNQADCMGNANQVGMVATQSVLMGSGTVTPDCQKVTNPMTSYYFKLDNIASVCPVDTSKNGTVQSSWTLEKRLCTRNTPCTTLSCMQTAGAVCLAFNGDLATCPDKFPLRQTWYQNATDTRACTCQCGGLNGSCAITNAEAQFTDSPTCSGGGQRTNDIAANQVNTCIQSNIFVNAVAAAALDFSPKPMCGATGTAPTDLQGQMAAGKVALTGPVTTCCSQ